MVVKPSELPAAKLGVISVEMVLGGTVVLEDDTEVVVFLSVVISCVVGEVVVGSFAVVTVPITDDVVLSSVVVIICLGVDIVVVTVASVVIGDQELVVTEVVGTYSVVASVI